MPLPASAGPTVAVPDPRSVFLNVPYDQEYAPLFVALIAGVIALGRAPRCALETLGLEDPFSPHIFRQLVASALTLAQEKGFIA